MGLALLCSLWIGYKTDKTKISTIFFFVFGIGTIGLFMITFIDDINSKYLYLAVICLNIGNAC